MVHLGIPAVVGELAKSNRRHCCDACKRKGDADYRQSLTPTGRQSDHDRYRNEGEREAHTEIWSVAHQFRSST